MTRMLACVVNVSEGRDAEIIGRLRQAAGASLLDVHSDGWHHRSVFTLVGPAGLVADGARSLAAATVEAVDLADHQGVHPRLGALDVVPFVDLAPALPRGGAGGREEGPSGGRAAEPAQGFLGDGDVAAAMAERDAFVAWAAAHLDLPCFAYGPGGPTLPALRRTAWRGRLPDGGPRRPHPTAGAACVGARPILVAYNLWLAEPDLATARRVAAAIRRPALRTLGLAVGERVQVSCNLVEPFAFGPADAWDAVAAAAGALGASVAGAELVGLLPAGVLGRIPPHRWAELDLSPSSTIEARLERAGLDGGRFGGGA